MKNALITIGMFAAALAVGAVTYYVTDKLMERAVDIAFEQYDKLTNKQESEKEQVEVVDITKWQES